MELKISLVDFETRSIVDDLILRTTNIAFFSVSPTASLLLFTIWSHELLVACTSLLAVSLATARDATDFINFFQTHHH